MTPFSFSKRNKLVATGCNYLLAANFTDLSSQHNTTSCSPLCDGSTNAVDCPDSVACCETHIPMDAAQKFTLKFEKTSGQITGEKGTCSTAFFLDQDDPDFRGGTAGGQRPLKDLLLPAGDRRMVLDWAIGSGTCDQPSTYGLAPLSCSGMSACIDAPRGAGYLCKCNAGYGGNPYTANGCADINECQNNKNDCSYPELCSNTEGGFTCSCPHNFIGDGHKKSTGCNCPPGMSSDGWRCQNENHSRLDTALGVGLALLVTITTTSLCYYWAMKRRKVRRDRAELFRKNGGLLLQQRFSAITSQDKESSAKIFSAEELKTATNSYSET
uniref:Uncharacterized protein n=1 Tax=Avena sativa TaxID=4498 RepID=A0ACD5UEZ6_AVESA